MEDLSQYKDHFILFLEAGFIAVNQADEESALKLFKAAKLLNKDNTMPRVGEGYLHLHKMELKQATTIFQEVLDKEPTNDMAKALLGVVLSLTPSRVAEGEKMLTELSTKTHEADVKNVAETAIDFVDNFVKKAAGPLEIKKKSK